MGGGCAAVTTAFELTRPEHRGRYEVTLYQLGWRLGGKGASGRGRAGRIEEHGLHLWMGHYENAFRLMRECYEELGRDGTCPIATWEDAFVPDPYAGVSQPRDEGGWRRFMARLPAAPGLPGDGGRGVTPTIPDYLRRATKLSAALWATLDGADTDGPGPIVAPKRPHPADAPAVGPLVRELGRALQAGRLATLTALLQGLELLDSALTALPRLPRGLVLGWVDALSASAATLLEAALERDPGARYAWEALDLLLATVRGVLRYGLVTDPRGFDAINEFDCRDFLRRNGASERSLETAFLRGMYDLAFAYEDGDPARPRIAAGQALRGAFRMLFTYRGSVFWKMQAGMGDVVFAPYYEVLRRRGVRFEFFHRLERVRLVETAALAPREVPYVTALDFDVQAHVRSGAYEPLVEVKGLPCWPSAPDWSQLVDGERLRREDRRFECDWDRRAEGRVRLQVGRDFDCVVLGVGVGAVPQVCEDFLERDARWRRMVEHVKTVPIQCFQIWLTEPMTHLGWEEPPPNMSGFVKPFDTWADMSHLAPAEHWEREPRAIAYFCGVFPSEAPPARSEGGHPEEASERAREDAVRFLNREIGALWPAAHGASGRFRWELLADPATGGRGHPEADETAFASQYWVVNTSPSDRYVLCLPGSIRHRISPLDATYDNFTIAGDWTDCGFNFGCVEAAVMSGRLAAHAVSGFPRLEDIHGYDHP